MRVVAGGLIQIQEFPTRGIVRGLLARRCADVCGRGRSCKRMRTTGATKPTLSVAGERAIPITGARIVNGTPTTVNVTGVCRGNETMFAADIRLQRWTR